MSSPSPTNALSSSRRHSEVSLVPPEYLDALDVVIAKPTIEEQLNSPLKPPVRSEEVGRRLSDFARRGSAVSHVDIGHFDPDGVHELRRTLKEEDHAAHPPAKDTSSGPSRTSLESEDSFDFEKTLRNIVQRYGESNVKSRELGILFKDLHVVGLGSSSSFQPTMGSLVSPSQIVGGIQGILHPQVRDILQGFEGVVRPGEMLLVLGRPGSGCSTLLKTLANQRKEYHSVSGEVHYDSLSPEQIAASFRGDVQYCPEDDVHFPTLTVGQTIRFAARTRTPQRRVAGVSRQAFVEELTTILATIFGLRHVMDTPVGDAEIRGVSGGQKKRVSICEALATRSCINCWDNSTRGLDASTALEFGEALRIATDITRMSTIVSIYQASESLYKLFDKICVIYEGRMAYYGPAHLARQYFIDMGYQPANRQSTADFLVAVTDPNGRIPRAFHNAPVPRTAAEFAEHFKASQIAKVNHDDMDTYRSECVGQTARASAFVKSAREERSRNTRPGSAYTISIPMQIEAVMIRRLQILRGDMTARLIEFVSFVIQGLIIGSIYLRVPETTTAFISRGGVLFSALLISGLNSISEIPALYKQRPIVVRHQRAALYHPFIESVAMTIVDMPVSLVTLATFSVIIYFMVGLQMSASQFFVFFLFVFSISETMKGLFRFLAAAFTSPSTAQSVAGVALLVLVLYTGFAIPLPAIVAALRWLGYINPLLYGFGGLLVNELHTLNATCSELVPSGPGYEGISLNDQVCTTIGSQAGQRLVDGNRFSVMAYGFQYTNLWQNFGIIVAFGVGFLALLFLFAEFNTALAGESSMTLYLRRRQAYSTTNSAATTFDEESRTGATGNEPSHTDARAESARALEKQPAMSNVFSWNRLEYSVPISGGLDRKLLDNVTGYVAPGKLTALMGESGAGKTTLLNVLAQRTTTGIISGERLVNGRPLLSDFQAQTGYCQQTDTHLPTATVREALLFSAKMRQPSSVPLCEKEEYVETCLKICGLEAWADASIGSLGLEHRKRTTIGVELAAKPKLLLFLDEPTSGLDSQSAWAIMAFLRRLADSGQAILCTIHQPSAELFQVFDRLLLLRRGGQTVYFGDLGYNAETLIHYFEDNGARTCLPDENPAEYMLQMIGAGATANSSTDWHGVWKHSCQADNLHKHVDNMHAQSQNQSAFQNAHRALYTTKWSYQVLELSKRGFVDYWRTPTYLLAKLALNIAGGLLIGFTFYSASDTLLGTRSKLFAIFISTILSVPLANQLQVPFIQSRTIYEIRERPSRMYDWTALVTSQILIEIPWNILGTSLFFFCWYWTVGFPTERAGYTFLLLSVIFPVYYTTIAQAVAAMVPNAEIAALVFSLLFNFVLTFNGVLQPYSQLGWWKWMYHVSPFTYLEAGLLGQAIGKQQITCEDMEFVKLNPPPGQSCASFLQQYISRSGGYLTNPDAVSQCQYCPSRTTDEFLGPTLNIYYSAHWSHLGIFCAFAAFNIFAIYFFTYVFRIRSGSILRGIKDCFRDRKVSKA